MDEKTFNELQRDAYAAKEIRRQIEHEKQLSTEAKKKGDLKLFKVKIGPATGKDGAVYGSHSQHVVILAINIDTAVRLARIGSGLLDISCPVDVKELKGPFINGDILAMWKK